MSADRVCVICKENDGRLLARLTQKGCDTLMNHSKKKGDSLDVKPEQNIHEGCRKEYTADRKRRLQGATNDAIRSPKTRKIAGGRFLYERNCIFCGTNIEQNENRHDYEDVVHRVETFNLQVTLRGLCKTRNDAWASEVLSRIECVNDLPAAEARYHKSCNSNFRTGRNIPEKYRSPSDNVKKTKGRPPNTTSSQAFLDTMQYFEGHENEQLSITELVRYMNESCENDAYSSVYMKKKILEYFGDNVIISEVNGKHDVVTFRSEAHAILHSFYKRNKNDEYLSEKEAIIKTASKFILNDIRSTEKTKDVYPQASEISLLEANLDYIPESLQMFLENIIDNKQGKKKTVSIGQSIVQTATPRSVICPLQLGLGVMVHHMSGSKIMVDCLSNLGFSLSYQEISRYERSAAETHGINIDTLSDEFLQFVADNVDHNICTLDGLHTFHGMGIIATVTPKLKRNQVIPRLNVSRDDVIQTAKIDIQFYKQTQNFMEEMKFKHLADVSNDDESDKSEELEFILKIARPLKKQLPGWSGTMQLIQKGNHHGESSVLFMPMIDMSSSDLSCIFSTLHFVAKQSLTHNRSAVLTFDQPLYWKALNIIKNEPDDSEIRSIVLRLGGFHSEMSFLGCIGRLMQNSGLKELLSTVYAENTVTHMLEGKAVSRAIRGHFLVDDALNTLLLETLIDTEESSCVTVASEMQHFDENELSKVNDILNEIETDKCLPESAHYIEVKTMITKFEKLKTYLIDFRTARLWIQYMEMVDNLKAFIKAERTGDWSLHLKSLQRMLPYFAAAGHNNYLKSAYCYLQEMLDLPKTRPGLYEAFCNGLHVVRRTDRYWGGLSTDLVIEQVLMKSLKSAGGLTRGRGMTESQRAQWLLSAPAMAEVNHAMQAFTGVSSESDANDQHKETSKSRLERDCKDRACLHDFLKQRNPFTEEEILRNIETGVTGDDTVTADKAKTIGDNIISKMQDQSVTSYSFKRKNEAVTLATRNAVKTCEIEISDVDPQVLFQRLITVSDSTLDDIEEIFKYELSGIPSSLFDSGGLLREAQKPTLTKAIWELGNCGANEIEGENVKYVLDGGSLIQRIPWKCGASFDTICESYADFVKKNYGQAHVVFDGYACGFSTKDETHLHRSEGVVGVDIRFNGKTPFTTKKESVLINTDNKQRFIDLLTSHLENRDIVVKNAFSDADVLIATTAVEVSQDVTTVVIGEDTDLLVLLCYHANSENKIYFTSDKSLNQKKIWDINETKAVLTMKMCDQLLFVHALSGCDTTSRIMGIGKGTVLKKFITQSVLQEQGSVFLQKEATHEEIARAGENALICLYSGNTESLDKLRYQKFITKSATSKNIVQVQSLPPTAAAATYHSYRVYHQVQAWLGNDLDPLQWGWAQAGNRLVPIKTDLSAGPERLLSVIKCNCKNCDTKRCSCRKHGLPCSSACGGCRGTGCSNSTLNDSNDDIE